MTCDRCLEGRHVRCRSPRTCSCRTCGLPVKKAKKKPEADNVVPIKRRPRPVAGAFADELIVEHCHPCRTEVGRRPPRSRTRWPRTLNRKSDARVAALMDINGASETEINEALGINLCYTGGRYPGRSRLERPDVRVAQIMRSNHAPMKEIAAALRLSVSAIEKWLNRPPTRKQAA